MAAVEHVFARQEQGFVDAFRSLPPDEQTLPRAIDLLWSIFDGPGLPGDPRAGGRGPHRPPTWPSSSRPSPPGSSRRSPTCSPSCSPSSTASPGPSASSASPSPCCRAPPSRATPASVAPTTRSPSSAGLSRLASADLLPLLEMITDEHDQPGRSTAEVGPTPSRDAFRTMVERLSRLSVDKHFDAYVDVDWDGPRHAGRPHRPALGGPGRRPAARHRLVPGPVRGRSGPASASTAGPRR